MSPSILLLASPGKQDKEIVGNPQISYFKYVFYHHTNFAINTHDLLFNDYVTWGNKIHLTIPRKGDLLNKMFLQIKIPQLSFPDKNRDAKWVSNLGHVMIDKIYFEIGGQCIDIQTGEWLYIQSQLTSPVGKTNGLEYMIGYDVDPTEAKIMYVPLDFWFNKSPNASLPLCALAMHEIKIKIHLKDFGEVAVDYDEPVGLEMSILADYYILDVAERMFFIKNKHEYLIDQVQLNMAVTTTQLATVLDLEYFNNPVKELVWVVQRSDSVRDDEKNWFDFSYQKTKNPIKSAIIRINGQELFHHLPGEFFNLVQPYKHHSNIPDNSGICVYSFALAPESKQPSGFVNFNRIDNVTLNLEFYPDYYANPFTDFVHATIKVYALSLNIFKVHDGIGEIVWA